MVDGNWVNATSKLNHYGDDSDEPRWIIEDTTLGSYTRNVSGPDGDLAATTSGAGDVRLQLTNLHGDVAATIDTALLEPEFLDYDEFGVPVAGQADQRYGWLGGKQRSGEAVGDVILMGVRLYSPGIGRFLQVDPVDGGNATAYDYCAGDPVNCTDLDGKFGWGSIKKGLSKVAKVASVRVDDPGAGRHHRRGGLRGLVRRHRQLAGGRMGHRRRAGRDRGGGRCGPRSTLRRRCREGRPEGPQGQPGTTVVQGQAPKSL